ncbi:hypothetical protein AA313_de0205563 [Arthrobotrys entomopaga]|nr:hypothetical protein AA313_de0205563 [Arthrobotrys entomopaga]
MYPTRGYIKVRLVTHISSIIDSNPSIDHASRFILLPNLAYNCTFNSSILPFSSLTRPSKSSISSSISLISFSSISLTSSTRKDTNASPILYGTRSSSSESSSSEDTSVRYSFSVCFSDKVLVRRVWRE